MKKQLHNKNLKEAKIKVAQKKKFYKHLIKFGVGSLIFITMNLIWEPDRIWFHYPTLA